MLLLLEFTSGGTIVHTGDFNNHCTPITGDMIDLSSFARVGDEGVLALLSESTNAEDPDTPLRKELYPTALTIFSRVRKFTEL